MVEISKQYAIDNLFSFDWVKIYVPQLEALPKQAESAVFKDELVLTQSTAQAGLNQQPNHFAAWSL